MRVATQSCRTGHSLLVGEHPAQHRPALVEVVEVEHAVQRRRVGERVAATLLVLRRVGVDPGRLQAGGERLVVGQVLDASGAGGDESEQQRDGDQAQRPHAMSRVWLMISWIRRISSAVAWSPFAGSSSQLRYWLAVLRGSLSETEFWASASASHCWYDSGAPWFWR